MKGEKMSVEHEKMKEGIVLVQQEKRKMEKDIGEILKAFELKTGLKPGIVFHERTNTLYDDLDLKYKVNIPVHL
jgi:hypothetical protein